MSRAYSSMTSLAARSLAEGVHDRPVGDHLSCRSLDEVAFERADDLKLAARGLTLLCTKIGHTSAVIISPYRWARWQAGGHS